MCIIARVDNSMHIYLPLGWAERREEGMNHMKEKRKE